MKYFKKLFATKLLFKNYLYFCKKLKKLKYDTSYVYTQ